MSTTNDFNARNIAEFGSNHGKVGGYFEGAPLLLLHSIGAHNGEPRINPLMYLRDGERHVVFASKAGAHTNPDWYCNLKVQPLLKSLMLSRCRVLWSELIRPYR